MGVQASAGTHCAPPAKEAYRILLYGDSNTAGFCDGGKRFVPYGVSLRKHLAAMGLRCKISWCGLSGFTAREMVEQIGAPLINDGTPNAGKGLTQLLSQGFHLVVIMAGTNDMLWGDLPERTLQNVAHLHATCHALGVPTVALAPPHLLNKGARLARHQFAHLLFEYYKSNSQVLACADVEMLLPRAQCSQCWEVDQLHLSPIGSETLGERLAPRLKSAIGSLPAIQSHAYVPRRDFGRKRSAALEKKQLKIDSSVHYASAPRQTQSSFRMPRVGGVQHFDAKPGYMANKRHVWKVRASR